jgi:hypothetical protein
MWIKKETYINMLSDMKALTTLLEAKNTEYTQFLQGQVQTQSVIAELTQARNGLIALAKARKVQLLELEVEPIGLDDIAELQQEVLGVHLENITRRLNIVEELITPTEDEPHE